MSHWVGQESAFVRQKSKLQGNIFDAEAEYRSMRGKGLSDSLVLTKETQLLSEDQGASLSDIKELEKHIKVLEDVLKKQEKELNEQKELNQQLTRVREAEVLTSKGSNFGHQLKEDQAEYMTGLFQHIHNMDQQKKEAYRQLEDALKQQTHLEAENELLKSMLGMPLELPSNNVELVLYFLPLRTKIIHGLLIFAKQRRMFLLKTLKRADVNAGGAAFSTLGDFMGRNVARRDASALGRGHLHHISTH